MLKVKKIIISLMTICVITGVTGDFNKPVFAAKNKTITCTTNYPTKNNVELNHAWTIKFNKPIDLIQDFSKVYIEDFSSDDLTKVDTVITISADRKSLIITPQKPYVQNNPYILNIDGIKSNGQVQKESTLMAFTTKSVDTTPTTSVTSSAVTTTDEIQVMDIDGYKDLTPLGMYVGKPRFTTDSKHKFIVHLNKEITQDQFYDCHIDVIDNGSIGYSTSVLGSDKKSIEVIPGNGFTEYPKGKNLTVLVSFLYNSKIDDAVKIFTELPFTVK